MVFLLSLCLNICLLIVTEGRHIYWDTCGAQGTTEWFSPSTMSALRIKLRLSGLEAPLPAEASQTAFLSFRTGAQNILELTV